MDVTHSLRFTVATLGFACLAACGPSTPPAPATIDPWPFTVDSVVLSCSPAIVPTGASAQNRRILQAHGARVYVTTADGVRYAVNGTARSDAPLMRDIQTTVDLAPLIERGLALCHGDRSGAIRLTRPSIASDPARSGQAQPRPSAAALAPPVYRLEPSQRGHGYFATAQADQAINGTRPEFTLACERGHSPMVILKVVQAPRTPPPLRGVYADFDTGDHHPRRIEMSWGSDATWTLRSGDERIADDELARALLASGRVSLTSASDYMPSGTLTWNFNGFSDNLGLLRRECGSN